MMKKAVILVLLVVLASCAKKELPFNAVTMFRDAEDKMYKHKYEDARKAYQEIQERAPDRSYDADIMLRIADTYYGEEKYSEAIVEYQAFLNFHPVHRDASYAQYQIGMCNYNELTTIDRDPGMVRTTKSEFQKLLDKYPGSPYEQEAKKYISICTEHLASYELYVGRFYFRKEAFKAAIGRFSKLLKEFPGTSAEKEALYYLGKAYEERGDRDQAVSTFETLAAKYPAMSADATSEISKIRAQ
jgi:outer membrane protein assembly factor BamD